MNAFKLLEKKDLRENVVDTLIITGIFYFLLNFFKPELIFLKTITTGGDTASHYYTAVYMRDVLLPRYQLFGWCPGNYAGFPMLQFYFFPPFLLMVLLSYFTGLEIAFKIVTILGTFLLPIFTYLGMRAMKFKFPIPIIAAVSTLSFLFMENNSMWGGNIPSTLAGEFSYSLSLSLGVLFLGTMYQGMKEKKFSLINALLLALIALTHVYVLLFVTLTYSLHLVMRLFNNKNLKAELKYYFEVSILAFLLVAFWLIPLLGKLSYTTAYNIMWGWEDFEKNFVPLILMPYLLLSVYATVYLLFNFSDDRINYILLWILSAAILFLLAPLLGVVNIRFAPFMQLTLVILGAYGMNLILEKMDWLKGKELIIFLIFLVTIVWINNVKLLEEDFKKPYEMLKKLEIEKASYLLLKNLKEHTIPEILKNKYHGFIPSWIEWNYRGFEKKPRYLEFKAINDFLRGNFSDPRVVYEHSDYYNVYGTTRAFESLPLFAGRATLEGLYMQSSVSAPFVFYIQSEIGEQRSCPFWNEWPCATFNLEAGKEHLKLFNVREFIARSNKAKKALDRDPEFKLLKRFGEVSIYRLVTNENKYVIVPRYEPVLFKVTPFRNWRKISYEWFKNVSMISIPLVFVPEFNEEDARLFKLKATKLGDLKAIELNKSCSIEEDIDFQEIKFRTNCTGVPHIIRFSYYPNWKVEGAKNIYLVSPSFMLVIPEQEEVRLYMAPTIYDTLGLILTLLAAFYIALILGIRISEIQSLSKFLKR